MPCRMTRREDATLGMPNSHAAFVTSIVTCVMYHGAYERMGRLKMTTTTQRTLRLEDLDDTVLFDVFYESGTMLGGWLLEAEHQALERGDDALAQSLREESFQMNRDRRGVRAEDRASQIAFKRQWDQRRHELDQLAN